MADCDDPECVQAFQRLQDARNLVLSLCELVTQLRASQDQIRSLIAVLELTALALTGVIIALGTLLPFPLNVIAGAVVGLVLLGVVIAIVNQFSAIARLQQEIDQALQDMSAARTAFDNAVAEIIATCDPPCWAAVDLDQPPCDSATDDAPARRRTSRSAERLATS